MSQNAVPRPPDDVATRVARRTFDKRGPDYAGEVRRLLDAGLEVMRACGTTSRARVADIVAAAGLSNDAFYRHFPSKDALVAAILEDGNERLGLYVAHQMSKSSSPEDQVRRWVEGVMAQADEEIAATTLAVLWNASGGLPGASVSTADPIAAPLHEPFAALGSVAPELDAALVAHATVGRLAEHLFAGTRPDVAEIEHLVAFCLAAARARVDGVEPVRPE
ncbi:MAG: TetR/AcrR family transcriptional regulator [Acidimicrobiia bacterium]